MQMFFYKAGTIVLPAIVKPSADTGLAARPGRRRKGDLVPSIRYYCACCKMVTMTGVAAVIGAPDCGFIPTTVSELA